MEHQRAVQNLAVESYLLDEMTPQERDAFEEHFFECSLCAEDVRSASIFLEDARGILRQTAAMEKAPLDKTTQRASRSAAASSVKAGWFGWLQPAFAAPALAILLVMVGIQSFRVIPNLRRQAAESGSPQLLTSIALRPVTRGEPASLSARPGSAVLLTLDLPHSPAAATPLQFVVESADGKEQMRVRGNAPEPGLPVSLMIPHLDFQAGTYTIVAELAAGADTRGQELGRFPFQLKSQ